jgi:hypothetical protein
MYQVASKSYIMRLVAARAIAYTRAIVLYCREDMVRQPVTIGTKLAWAYGLKLLYTGHNEASLRPPGYARQVPQ